MEYRSRLTLLILLIPLPGLMTGVKCFGQAEILFDRDVRPILADNCYACHGPDEAASESDLRLDQKDSVFGDLGSYAAVVPGNTHDSELIRRIASDDPDEVMPPAEHRKKLTDAQKHTLVQWVEQGAQWSSHWAFTPPKVTANPAVGNDKWPINFIDYYVLFELERQGIEPSPVATGTTLLRRLSFDLTGLPPTIEGIDSCDFDSDPSAYDRAVEQMLNSRHFGERMAVYWLDLVRYADTVGYHGDQPVSVSPYRDYVINAFNNNMPFDQFTLEQLAGDLLDNPTRDQLVASGYNRLGMMSAEGGVQPEEYINKYASDRVRTTASAWTGLTLGCAECHDHKFDPVRTSEFYEFAAFFADIQERGLYEGAHESKDWGPHIAVPGDELPELLKPIDQQIAKRNSQILASPDLAIEQAAWESEIVSKGFEWTVLRPQSVKFALPTDATIQDDDSVLVHGDNPNENCTIVTAEVSGNGARAIRLETLPNSSLPSGGAGRAVNGNFVVTEFLLVRGNELTDVLELKKSFEAWPDEYKSATVALQNATVTIEQLLGGENHPDKKWSAASTIDHDVQGSTWGWSVLPDANKPNELVVQIADSDPVSGPVTIVIQQYHGQGNHTLGQFRLSFCEDGSATSDPWHRLPEGVKQALALKIEERSDVQQQTVCDYFVSVAPRLAETRQQIAELEKQRAELVDIYTPTSPITVSVPPREVRVLSRGNWMDKTGAVVSPNVPVVLGRPQWDAQPTRKELAQWLVCEANPLTARVFVNRIWALMMGSGLAPILDDFGAQGSAPSHPELLDRLAVEFVNSGWDVKQLVRTIVSSQTYRQSSAWREDLNTVDPENRLRARQSRFRLPAEFIRDNVLASSGLLFDKIGGRSVFPYQPVGLYRHLNFPPREYQASVGGDQYRRGLYTHWQRQYLHPAMKTFDAPAREECQAARPRSSTPLGALLMLNDPSVVEASRALADRAIANDREIDGRLDFLYLRTIGRHPSVEEQDVLKQLLKQHQSYFDQNPESAKALLATGQYQAVSNVSPSELAAWASVCRAVYNLHEFIQRN